MNLCITRFEAIAELIQADNFCEAFSTPGDMLSGGPPITAFNWLAQITQVIQGMAKGIRQIKHPLRLP